MHETKAEAETATHQQKRHQQNSTNEISHITHTHTSPSMKQAHWRRASPASTPAGNLYIHTKQEARDGWLHAGDKADNTASTSPTTSPTESSRLLRGTLLGHRTLRMRGPLKRPTSMLCSRCTTSRCKICGRCTRHQTCNPCSRCSWCHWQGRALAAAHVGFLGGKTGTAH